MEKPIIDRKQHRVKIKLAEFNIKESMKLGHLYKESKV